MGENVIFAMKESDGENTVAELKKRLKPVYIYGNADTAQRVFDYLDAHQVEVSGLFVDDAYWTGTEERGAGSLLVYSFQYVMDLPEADVVIGFYQFGLAYQKIQAGEMKNHGNVYFVHPVPLFDYGYYLKNKLLFEETYGWLGDELSRETMRAYMDGRMNGVMKPLWQCSVPDQYFIPEIKFEDRGGGISTAVFTMAIRLFPLSRGAAVSITL